MGLSFLPGFENNLPQRELMFLGSWHKESGAGPGPSPCHLCSSDGAGLRREEPYNGQRREGEECSGRASLEVERNSQEGPGSGFCVSPPPPQPKAPSQTLGSKEKLRAEGGSLPAPRLGRGLGGGRSPSWSPGYLWCRLLCKVLSCFPSCPLNSDAGAAAWGQLHHCRNAQPDHPSPQACPCFLCEPQSLSLLSTKWRQKTLPCHTRGQRTASPQAMLPLASSLSPAPAALSGAVRLADFRVAAGDRTETEPEGLLRGPACALAPIRGMELREAPPGLCLQLLRTGALLPGKGCRCPLAPAPGRHTLPGTTGPSAPLPSLPGPS